MNQFTLYMMALACASVTGLALLADSSKTSVNKPGNTVMTAPINEDFNPNLKANILFDLNGVLMDTKKATAANVIGLIPLIRIFVNKMNPREFFFEYFDSIMPRAHDAPFSCDEHGRPTPQLMIDWMSGTRTGKDIYEFICKSLKENQNLKKHEKKAIRRFSKMLFGDPELFVTTKKMVEKGVKFVKECKRGGHKVFIISNWDVDSIAILRKQVPEFFELFDGIIISAEVGLLKPDARIFQHALDTYGLDASHTILIDDQKENIEGAQKCGIAGIHMQRSGTPLLTKPDWKRAKREFYSWCRHNYPQWATAKI